MTDTITLADLEKVAASKAAKWERNGIVRHYINVPGAAYKLYWTVDGKVHFALGKGRSTPEANAVAEAVIGCNVVDRYSRTNGPAAYVVVE